MITVWCLMEAIKKKKTGCTLTNVLACKAYICLRLDRSILCVLHLEQQTRNVKNIQVVWMWSITIPFGLFVF